MSQKRYSKFSTSDIGQLFLSVTDCAQRCHSDTSCVSATIVLLGNSFPYGCKMNRNNNLEYFKALVKYYSEDMDYPPLFISCPLS